MAVSMHALAHALDTPIHTSLGLAGLNLVGRSWQPCDMFEGVGKIYGACRLVLFMIHRYCKKCRQYSVEDEKHFPMECPAYQDI
jgi:hypothetical protein